MSGGSYSYAYVHVEGMGATLANSTNPLRAAFGLHLLAVAKAMHAVEWVDSCDWGEGDDVAPMRAVVSPAMELSAALTNAEHAELELRRAIDLARKVQP